MENILLSISIGLMNVLCFFIGAKVGQKVVKGENINFPSVNPMKIIQSQERYKEERKRQKEIKIIMDNIDNYDGTSIGQQEIPE